MYKKTLLLGLFLGFVFSLSAFASSHLYTTGEDLNYHIDHTKNYLDTAKNKNKNREYTRNYFLYFDTTNFKGENIKQIYEITSVSKASNFIGFKLQSVEESITIDNLMSKKCLNIHPPLDPSIKSGLKNELLLVVKKQKSQIQDWNTPPPVPFVPVPFYILPNTAGQTQYRIERNTPSLRDRDIEWAYVQFDNWIKLEGIEEPINYQPLSQSWIPPLFTFCNVYSNFYL